MTATGTAKRPFGILPRLLLAWVSTEAVLRGELQTPVSRLLRLALAEAEVRKDSAGNRPYRRGASGRHCDWPCSGGSAAQGGTRRVQDCGIRGKDGSVFIGSRNTFDGFVRHRLSFPLALLELLALELFFGGFIGFVVLGIGAGMTEPPETPVATPAPAQSPTVTDSRVHSDSDFTEAVEALIAEGALEESVTDARAFNNDVELTFSANAARVLAAAGCEQQRDFAAAQWFKWRELVPRQSGAGVEILSPTGRILASAEEGFTGPRFHCE